MADNFAIMRTEKVKSVASLANMEKHCSREKMPKNADPEKATLNKSFINDKLSLPERFAKMTKGQTVRKNAVMAVEVMMTASPDAMQSMTSLNDWVKENKKWLDREFGKSNVVRMYLHMDETTPHLHAVVIPLDEKGKLNCRSFLGGADKLTRLQDTYAKAMQPFNLERGVKGSKAHHKTVKEFYRAIEGAERKSLPEPNQEVKKGIMGQKTVTEGAEKYYTRANKAFKQQGMQIVDLQEKLRKEKAHNKTVSVKERMEQAQQRRDLEKMKQQVQELPAYRAKSSAWDALEQGLNSLPDKTQAEKLKWQINGILEVQRAIQENEYKEREHSVEHDPGRGR